MRQRSRRILGENGGLVGVRDFSNMCIEDVAHVDEWYGHIHGSGSSVTPPIMIGVGLSYYEMKWNDSGDMVLRLGHSGTDKIFDVNNVFVYDNVNKKRGLYTWSDSNLQYERNDPAWTALLISNMFQVMCFMVMGELNPYEIINGTNDIWNGTNNIVNDRE